MSGKKDFPKDSNESTTGGQQKTQDGQKTTRKTVGCLGCFREGQPDPEHDSSDSVPTIRVEQELSMKTSIERRFPRENSKCFGITITCFGI